MSTLPWSIIVGGMVPPNRNRFCAASSSDEIHKGSMIKGCPTWRYGCFLYYRGCHPICSSRMRGTLIHVPWLVPELPGFLSALFKCALRWLLSSGNLRIYANRRTCVFYTSLHGQCGYCHYSHLCSGLIQLMDCTT